MKTVRMNNRSAWHYDTVKCNRLAIDQLLIFVRYWSLLNMSLLMCTYCYHRVRDRSMSMNHRYTSWYRANDRFRVR
jgi:hypothetical protein